MLARDPKTIVRYTETAVPSGAFYCQNGSRRTVCNVPVDFLLMPPVLREYFVDTMMDTNWRHQSGAVFLLLLFFSVVFFASFLHVKICRFRPQYCWTVSFLRGAAQ